MGEGINYEHDTKMYRKQAQAIVGNDQDASDAVQNAFVHVLANGVEPTPETMEVMVDIEAQKLAERRVKRPQTIGNISPQPTGDISKID